jgi:hypothetical protein
VLSDVEVPTFCLDSRLKDGGKVVSLTLRPHLTPGRVRVLILLEVESTPGP